jgi:hypothetical protein
MANYTGNTKVNGGYYFCPRTWNVNVVPSEGGTLPGPAGARYIKVPFPLLFLVVPVIGLAFLIFLPFIGFALFAWAIAKRISGGLRRSATELAATVSPGTATGAAYMTGKEGEEPAEKVSEELEKMEKTIEEKRAKE